MMPEDGVEANGAALSVVSCHSPVAAPFVAKNVAEAQRRPLTTLLHGGKSRVEKQKRDPSRRRGQRRRQCAEDRIAYTTSPAVFDAGLGSSARCSIPSPVLV